MTQQFNPLLHIVNLEGKLADGVNDGTGGVFSDIRGRSGVRAAMPNGVAIGVDLIEMAAGTAFEPHTHSGAHVLVVREGRGSIAIDGIDYPLREGDSVYVPADYAHGVSAGSDSGMLFIAFGVPHLPISSPDRMTLVKPEPVRRTG